MFTEEQIKKFQNNLPKYTPEEREEIYQKHKESILNSTDENYFYGMIFYMDLIDDGKGNLNPQLRSFTEKFKKEDYDNINKYFADKLPSLIEAEELINKYSIK